MLSYATHCKDDDGTRNTPKYQGRVYGPVRLPRLLRGYAMLGWVWQGQRVFGGLDAAAKFDPANETHARGSSRGLLSRRDAQLRSWRSFWFHTKRLKAPHSIT
jgi:hypothetical protein